MSAAVQQDRPRMPNGALYHSPRGLYDFQAEAVARSVIYGEHLIALDRGMGKTHVAMCSIAQMIDSGQAAIAMMIGRKPKIAHKDEFPADFAQYTSLDAFVYHGAGRQARLAKHGVPEVFMTTYETGRAELMQYLPGKPGTRSKGVKAFGQLVRDLDLVGKPVLWMFDEVAKFGGRTSELYKSYWWVIDQLARKAPQYRIGLTATPESTELNQPFNIFRILTPKLMPLVGAFEDEYTAGKDDFGHYRYRDEHRAKFAQLIAPRTYRKRITDSDVRDQMPKLVTDFIVVEMEPAHAKFYQAVEQLFGDDPTKLTKTQQGQLAIALKLTAGHPASHLHSDSQLSRAIVETMGEAFLRDIPSSKTVRLIEELQTIVTDQGAQVVVFSWYANTVLPELAIDLQNAGFKLAVYQSDPNALADFKAGKAEILLCSDAASEGLNIPEATYVIEYESAETWTRRQQRFGRHVRIDSTAKTVFGLSMVLAKTREVGVVRKTLTRKDHDDVLLGDKGEVGHLDVSTLRRELKEALPDD